LISRQIKAIFLYFEMCTHLLITYTGQTGSSFYPRFNEYLKGYRQNNGKSQFSQHLLENENSIGPAKEIMRPVSIINKGRHIKTMGRFYIHTYIYKVDNKINDDKNHLVDTIKFSPDTLRSLPSFLIY